MNLPACKIILVRPRDPNNIGAAARAMKNFGLSELIVVAPHPPVWNEIVAAVNADDILQNAQVENSLAAAVADCTVVIGTKDKTNFAAPQILPAQLAQFAHEKCALVFGSEKHGLTNEELSYCHYVLSIPTQPDCPSINLAQAVAICCYELQRKPLAKIPPPGTDVATAGEIEQTLAQLNKILTATGFTRAENQAALTQELRQMFLQHQLTAREIKLFRGIIRQIDWKLSHPNMP